MANCYQTFELLWCGRTVSVSYQDHWLNSDHWHIELRCAERLPVTESGYRSYIAPCAEDAEEADVRGLVMGWLDTAAKSKKWQEQVDADRQLDLFD